MPSADGPPGGSIGWMNFEYLRTGVEPNKANASVAVATARLIGPESVPMKRSACCRSAAASLSPRSQALTAGAPDFPQSVFAARAHSAAADQKYRSCRAQAVEEFRPICVGPILGAGARRRCRARSRAAIAREFIADRRERIARERKCRARSTATALSSPPSARAANRPADRENVVVDTGIGDEEFLRSEPQPDALGYAGEPGGDRRPDACDRESRACGNARRRSSAASRIRLMPRRSSEPACSK